MSLLDACVIDLAAKGIDKARAMRACVIAQHSSIDGKIKNKPMSDIAIKIVSDAASFSVIDKKTGMLSTKVENETAKFELEPQLKDPIYPFPENPTVPVLLRECLMVRVGIFNGIEVTSEDLDKILENFSSPIPIITDHNELTDNQCGWVMSMRRVGNKIIGLCEFIGKKVVELIQTRRLRKTSIGFYYGSFWQIYEYSFVVRPAVDDSGVIPINDSKVQPHSTYSEVGTTIKNVDSEQETKLKGPEDMPKTAEELAAEAAAKKKADGEPAGEETPTDESEPTDPAKAKKKMSKEVAAPAAALSAGSNDELLQSIFAQQKLDQARFAKLEADNAALLADNAALKKEQKEKSDKDLYTSFALKGMAREVCKTEEQSFIASLSATQLEKYTELKNKQGPLIELGRKSLPVPDDADFSKNDPEYIKNNAEFSELVEKKFKGGFKKKEGNK